VQCLNSNGFEYCFECLKYTRKPCEKHGELAARWAVDNVDLRANLERICGGEVETWLKECEEKIGAQNAESPCQFEDGIL